MKTYDPNTDTIYGCKEGTISYYHEEGHRKQFKSGMIGTMEMFQRWFIYLFLFCIALMSEYKIFTYLVTLVVLPEILLEIDAWIFAIKKYMRERK